MMTVSAVARLMPRPPARVERRKQNCWAPGAEEERRVSKGLKQGCRERGTAERRTGVATGGGCGLITDSNSRGCVLGEQRAAHLSPTQPPAVLWALAQQEGTRRGRESIFKAHTRNKLQTASKQEQSAH